MSLVLEPTTEADARSWLSGAEIASGLQRAESTVYSALAAYAAASRAVGHERRFHWIVGFELCRKYAVPDEEYARRVTPFLWRKAKERGSDPKQLLTIFIQCRDTWRATQPPDEEVTPEMIRRLSMPAPGRRDAAAVAASLAVEQAQGSDVVDQNGPGEVSLDRLAQAERQSP